MTVIPPTTYCTDEDIAIESQDYYNLCPNDQVSASGTDGTMTAVDPWGLHSVSTDFAVCAVAPGTMAYLMGPALFGAEPGTPFAVSGVDPLDPHRLLLHRKGWPDGTGAPPVPGGAVGITFQVVSLAPQILLASQEIDDRFDLSSSMIANNLQLDDYTSKKIKRLCIYLVLARRYLSVAKGNPVPGGQDVWTQKATMYVTLYNNEADELTTRLSDTTPTRRRRSFARFFRIS